MLLCASHADIYSLCTALAKGTVPWETVVMIITASFVGPYALRLRWFSTVVLSCIVVVVSTIGFALHVSAFQTGKVRGCGACGPSASSRHTADPHRPLALAGRGQVFVGLTLVTLVTSSAAQRHDNAERDFWASLNSTARAQFLQGRAEERGTEASKLRDVAVAETQAVQTVMRYVCHELRNPLHGIMVRPSPSRRLWAPPAHPAGV